MVLIFSSSEVLIKNKIFKQLTYLIEINKRKTQGFKMIITNFETLIKQFVLMSIKDIEEMRIIKSDMLKKLIYKREIEVTKIGSKNFISRTALIHYLEANTIPAEADTH